MKDELVFDHDRGDTPIIKKYLIQMMTNNFKYQLAQEIVLEEKQLAFNQKMTLA